MDDYVDVLTQEIQLKLSYFGERLVSTIYFGGGTPTYLRNSLIIKILEACFQSFSISKDAEVSVEANPENLHGKKLRELRKAGFNRLSLGVQSFNEDELRILGRSHRVSQILGTYHQARQAGFENINLDLIFAIPRQNLPSWFLSLKKAVYLQPEHISTYSLSVESETKMEEVISSGRVEKVSEDVEAEMYEMAMDYLTSSGYKHYEISNFCRQGYECRHNKIYWKNGDYLGLGAGAHSYLNQSRFYNSYSITEYIGDIKSRKGNNITKLSIKDEMAETMFLGLRLLEGVGKNDFSQRFGKEIKDVYYPQIKRLIKTGLLKEEIDNFVLTRKGIFLANEVFVEFI